MKIFHAAAFVKVIDMKKTYSAGILLLAAALLAGIALIQEQGSEMKRYETTFFDSFDTVTVITGYAESQKEFEEQAGKLQEKLRYYHELFDIFTPSQNQ